MEYEIPKETKIRFGRNEFQMFVLDNIVSNINEHAFCGNKFSYPQVYIKVFKEGDLVQIRICNNGESFEGNAENIFVFNENKIPDNRLGTYLIKVGMEHYGGCVSIETDADHFKDVQYTVTYVLTFKTNEI